MAATTRRSPPASIARPASSATCARAGPASTSASSCSPAGSTWSMSNSFEAFTYVREDAPFFTIAAIFQKDPQVLIGHPDTGFDGFEKLKGRTLLIGSGGTGHLLALPAPEVRALRQPAQALQLQHGAVPRRQERGPAGLPLVRALFDRPGARPAAVGAADRRCGLQRLPDHDRDLAQAGRRRRRSWCSASSTPRSRAGRSISRAGRAIEAANALIKRANPEQTDDRIAYAIKVLNERGIVMSGDALKDGIGAMSAERWKKFLRLDGRGRACCPRGWTSAAPIRWNS